MMTRQTVLKTYKLFIKGAFPRSESGRSLAVHGVGGEVVGQISHASRKDLRDAVEAAAGAQPKWADAGAYNKGQVLYRLAEMIEGKRGEFADALVETSRRGNVETSKAPGRKASRHQGIKASRVGNRAATVRERNVRTSLTVAQAQREVDASIDRVVCFAGWADKYAQVLGCANPVAGPYYNFTIPEPTGVVGVVGPPPPAPGLLGLVSLIAPPLCAGNAIVALADDDSPIPAVLLAEACATADVPPGVVNILTGRSGEVLEHLTNHREVNAISAANLTRETARVLRMGVAENLKRVHIAAIAEEEWLDAEVCESPWTIEHFVEFKTIWHPSAS